jgi:hypothetical protein
LQNLQKVLEKSPDPPGRRFREKTGILISASCFAEFFSVGNLQLHRFHRIFRRTGSCTDNTAKFLVLSSGLQQPELSIQRTGAQRFSGGLETRCATDVQAEEFLP